MKRRSYSMKCPREGRDVTLFFEGDGVGFSCSELRHEFVKCRGKWEVAYYTCKIMSNKCPYEDILYILLKKIEPEAYLKEES